MKVIKQWLGGDTRDKIATDNQIGAGTALLFCFSVIDMLGALSSGPRQTGPSVGGVPKSTAIFNEASDLNTTVWFGSVAPQY